MVDRSGRLLSGVAGGKVGLVYAALLKPKPLKCSISLWPHRKIPFKQARTGFAILRLSVSVGKDRFTKPLIERRLGAQETRH